MENALIQGLPSSGYYVPDFIDKQEAQHILNQIEKTPEGRWTKLTHRRLLSVPSQLTGAARDTLLAAPLPEYLRDPILPRLEFLFSDSPHTAPNHVLVNEYQAGQGIMPHEDGPAYFPITATVSLGGHTVLEIYEKNANGEREPSPSWRILQEPRSLLVTVCDMYKNTLHGIGESPVDYDLSPNSIINWSLLGDASHYEAGSAVRSTRISLTYRDVLKVAKLGGALNFMGKR